MIARINASLSTLGIRSIRIPAYDDSDAQIAYEAGRRARHNGIDRAAGRRLDPPSRRNWERGWDVVDYKLRHPNPEIS